MPDTLSGNPMYRRDLLADIASRAAHLGPMEPAFPRAGACASIEDRFDATYRALIDAYPFLYSGSEGQTTSELARYDSLFAWLIQSLTIDGGYAATCDVVQLLALTSLMDCHDRLWPTLIAAAGTAQLTLVNEISTLLQNFRTDGAEILLRRKDANTVQLYKDLVTAKNWQSLYWMLQDSWHDFRVELKQHASIALYHLDKGSLRNLFEDEQDFFQIATYVLHAPTNQSMDLAMASRNWTLKFLALFFSAQQAVAGAKSYPVQWASLMVEASRFPEEWGRWMAALNNYPARFPQLQDVLGEILSDVSEAALDAYTASLPDTDSSRQQVAATLSRFRKLAPLSHRQRVWTAAYHRWREWDFGCSKESCFVGEVKRSAFDFPVIGYLTECLDESGRIGVHQQIASRAAAIDTDWYAEISQAVTERFKLISIYQLLIHADQVASGAVEWCAELVLHQPPWEDGSLFRALRYEPTFRQPTFLSV